MNWLAIVIVLVVLVITLSMKVPVALSLGIAGTVGLFLVNGGNFTLKSLGAIPFQSVATFTFTIIPMFILMGAFALHANIAKQVFDAAHRLSKRLPGGLAVATVMACAGFSAVSGSSIGTAATMAKLSVEEMKERGYRASVATGVVAVAGTLGAMIPPSAFLVLYAVMTNNSVSQMLIAGIIPGIISALAYSIYIIVSTRNVSKAEKAVDRPTLEKARPIEWRGIARLSVIFAIIVGGMYSGIFTPTESAAIGALAALVFLADEKLRYGEKSWKDFLRSLRSSLLDSAGTSGMVFLVIIGSSILTLFFVTVRLPDAITQAIADSSLPSMLIMGLLLLCLIPLGMVLESISILLITVPILYPVAMELGFDPIWLGVMIVKLIELGMVTPPVGIVSFVVAGVTKTPVSMVFRGVTPFVLVDIVVVALFFLVPAIVIWLPGIAAIN